jgi:heme O synthase-like polyprenyltransferase
MFTAIMILLLILIVAFVALLVTTGLTILYYAVPVLVVLGCVTLAIKMIKSWFKTDKKKDEA